MGHDVGYVVWTPPDYSTKVSTRYPVIYFLHGAGGNESADAAGFSSWVARAIGDGSLPPVLCVFPNGGMSGYRGEVEKMITEELIPTIDKDYRTVTKPEVTCAGRILDGRIRVKMNPDSVVPVHREGGDVALTIPLVS